MDDLVTERQQKAQVGGFDLHFLRFLRPFRPISAVWAVTGRNDATLADSADRSAGLRRPHGRSADCGSWPGRDSGPWHNQTFA